MSDAKNATIIPYWKVLARFGAHNAEVAQGSCKGDCGEAEAKEGGNRCKLDC